MSEVNNSKEIQMKSKPGNRQVQEEWASTCRVSLLRSMFRRHRLQVRAAEDGGKEGLHGEREPHQHAAPQRHARDPQVQEEVQLGDPVRRALG